MKLSELTLEQLNSLMRGSFSNGFFHIYVDGVVDVENLGNMTQKDKGTLLHEFCHYIQNIGSLWGMYQTLAQYEAMIEAKQYILANNELEIPLKIDFSDNYKRKKNWIDNGNGTTGYWRGLKVDRTQPITYEIKPIDVNGSTVEYVEVKAIFEGVGEKTFKLGAHIVKESMSAMYQSLIDPDAEHYDFPYNIVELICAQSFPELAKDKRRLICACFASLYTLVPGPTLLYILKDESVTPSENGMDLLASWVFNRTVVTGNGERLQIVSFYDKLAEGFKTHLRYNILSELEFTQTSMERTKPSTGYMPLLSILYSHESLSDEILKEMMFYYGVPYIHTPTAGMHLPLIEDAKSVEDASMDVLELIAQEAVFNILNDPTQHVCPLYYMCSGSDFDKDECFSQPWLGGECVFKLLSDSWQLNKKKITRKT